MRRSLALVLVLVAAWPAAAHAAEPTVAPLAITQPPAAPGYLARLDPLTLAPLEPRAELTEWHGAYSFSPDRTHLATSTSNPGMASTPGVGRVGARIYDLRTMEIVREFRTGGFVPAVGWLAPRRLLLVQRRVRLADPVTGATRTTDTVAGPGCVEPEEKVVTRSRLVFLLGSTLNAVDRNGDRTHATLRGMSDDCGRLGMAADLARELVYVVGVGGEVAVIRPRPLRVRYVPVGRSRATRVDATRAQGFGAFRVAAAHVNSRGMPKGVELVDTLRRSRRMIDPRAGGAQVAGERLLAYDGRYTVSSGGSKGIRVFDLAGRLRHRLLTDEVVNDVDVLGGFAYARTRGGLRVIDLSARRVVSRSALDPDLPIEFVVPERAGR